MDKPVALITGASSGIGAACARVLQDSHRLILVARREQRLKELADALPEARPLVCDLSEPAARDQLMAQAEALYGGIDVLINNAGIFETGAADAIDEAQMNYLWRLNVNAPLLLTRDALPLLRQSSNAVIITISSIAAVADFPQCSVYAASKAAVEAWSRSLREELRGDGIRVSIIAPGATSTEVWDGKDGFDTSRMMQADDIAAAVRSCVLMPVSASVDKLTLMPPGGAL